jgi:hypothetical protein
VAVVLAGAGGGLACHSSTTGVVGPSASKCALSVSGAIHPIAAEGGNGSLSISVAPECLWSVSSAADWISITSPKQGQGSTVVEFVAAPNPRAAERRGAVVISERTVDLRQAGARCELTVTPAAVTVAAAGGDGMISLTTIDGCQWSAVSDAAWLAVTSARSGIGTGSVHFRADANGGPERSGTIRVGPRSVIVRQHAAGAACAFSLGRTATAMPPAGGQDTVVVTATGTCSWTAQSLVPWMVVTQGTTGNGQVTLTVAPNTAGPRLGTATIAGITYYVTQDGVAGCSFALSSLQQTVAAAGGAAMVGVAATDGCAWTAFSQAPWINLVAGAAGTGNGTVTVDIATNTGPERTGEISIAGQTHTITQRAVLSTCSYSLDSASVSIAASGGMTQFGVTADAGCAWTAVSQASWIALVNGSGSGDGTVRLSVAQNTGAARTGAVTLGTATFTVMQSAAPNCTYTLTPTKQQVPALGGDFSVFITTQPGCTWSAAAQDGWIQITSSASGVGSSTLSYKVSIGLLFSRSGQITIAGQVLRVDQAALLLESSGQ